MSLSVNSGPKILHFPQNHPGSFELDHLVPFVSPLDAHSLNSTLNLTFSWGEELFVLKSLRLNDKKF